MAAKRRLFLSGTPFRFLAAHLVRDSDFLEYAQAILRISDDSYQRLATDLARSDAFLARDDVARIVHESLDDDDDGQIADAINDLAFIIHDSGTSAGEAMDELANAIEDAPKELETSKRDLLLERIRKLVAEPTGIAKQFKARQLVNAVGSHLNGFRVICDIRPIFDANREGMDGAIPISVIHLEYETQGGDSAVVDLCVTEKQIKDISDRLADALKKLSMTKHFLAGQGIPVPRTKATLSEGEP
jgi:hypothetical protein